MPRMARPTRPKLPADYREAARLCARWEGARVGDGTRCRSALVGRTLTVRLRKRDPAVRVEVVGCAVPRSDRKTKRCKVDYLVRPLAGQGVSTSERVVDGGRIRNASRTPRPTHDPAMRPDRDDPRRFRFYDIAQSDNRRAGLPRTAGLDLPFRHRVGSSICCPQHPDNPSELAQLLNDARDDGAGMPVDLRRRILRLGKHMRDKHGVALRVPSMIGRRHYRVAERILEAGDGYCARMLDRWEEHARMDAEERRKRPRKRKTSVVADKRRKRLAAVKRASGDTRAQVMRAMARDRRAA